MEIGVNDIRAGCVAHRTRQIDDVKQAQGSVYGARDVLLNLRDRVDRMERPRLGANGK